MLHTTLHILSLTLVTGLVAFYGASPNIALPGQLFLSGLLLLGLDLLDRRRRRA
ncbi:MAG: hypothetical protein ACE37K_11865 [Planctomycetota bacterium]